MTANQIAYWNYKEKVRNNKAVETETNRANLVREAETNRSNRMREYQTFQQRMQDRELKRIDQREVERSHRANEWRDYWTLQETKRHNSALESAQLIQAESNMTNAETNRQALHENIRANQVKERQQQQQIDSVANLNAAKVYQGYRANDIQSAFTYGSLEETKRSNLASEGLKALGIEAEEYRNREITRHNLTQERETQRHNEETETRQMWQNILNAGQLLVSFKRQKSDDLNNTIRSITSVGKLMSSLTKGGSL